MTTKLFKVTSTVPEFRGHKDVHIGWFVLERPAPTNWPYRELIEGEFVDEDWTCQAIDELFSDDEAAAWAAWLRKNRPGEHAIAEAELPYATNVMPTTTIPLGGGQDCLTIWRSPGYDLPFKVEGYFDLRGHELVSKREAAGEAMP